MLSNQMNLPGVLLLFPSQLATTIIHVNFPHQLGEYQVFPPPQKKNTKIKL